MPSLVYLSTVNAVPCTPPHATINYPERRRAHVERYAFDQDYLERLASGDAETERHFASYFGQLLLIKLRGRLRNPQLVADLRQETFMRVFQAIRKRNAVMYPERLGSFVNSVCENVLLEFFRSDKANVHAQDELHEPSDEAATVESELISEERSALVRKILGEMSDSDRKILSGVFLEERDKDQLCLEMKIDRGNLRVRIHRALARFRSCLQNRELIANRSQAARRGA